MSRFSRPTALFHPVLHCRDASRTRQEFLADSMIGNIIKRFCQTGVLDQPNAGRPLVDGLSLPDDFTEGMNGITRIRNEGISEADLENSVITQEDVQSVEQVLETDNESASVGDVDR